MPFAMALGGIATFVFNQFVLRPIFLSDLDELGLAQKYFSLDLNADMMREDLEQYGIAINAKHFDLESTEQRLTTKREDK